MRRKILGEKGRKRYRGQVREREREREREGGGGKAKCGEKERTGQRDIEEI